MHDTTIARSTAGTRDGLILIAEDDAEMRRLVAEGLRDEGYRVAEASSGAQLLAYLRTAAYYGVPDLPDLVLSDVRMPGWSGLEVLAILDGLDTKTPVVLMTAFGDLELRLHAMEFGARALLDKPFDMDELKDVISGILG